MIIDRDFMFSNALELKASANSTVIDTQAEGDAIGQELTFHNVINEDFAGATSLTIKIQSSENKTAWNDAVISPAIPVAELTKGADVFSVRVPKGLKRYIRLAYTIAGTGTAGKITSFASKDL
jgi:hypothetical protein